MSSHFTSFSLNIQSKFIRKLVKLAVKPANGSGKLLRYNVVVEESAGQLRTMQQFIEEQLGSGTRQSETILQEISSPGTELVTYTQHVQTDSPAARAKQVVHDVIAISSKLAVVFWSGLMSEEETEALLRLSKAEKEVAVSLLKLINSCDLDKDLVELMERLGDVQYTLVTLLRMRFSSKTVRRAESVCEYLVDENVYRYLIEGEGTEQYRATASLMMARIISNQSEFAGLMEKRTREGRIEREIRSMVEEIRIEEHARIEKQLGKPIPRDESFSFLGPDSYEALFAIYSFVELQSGDVTKAQDILRSLLTIMAQIEIGHDADLYTDEDELKAMHVLVVVRELLETLLELANNPGNGYQRGRVAGVTTSENTFLLHKLEEQFEAVNTALIELMSSHFGGDTQIMIRSLFFYFSRDHVVDFFLSQEEEGQEMRRGLVEFFRKFVTSMQDLVLTDHSETGVPCRHSPVEAED